MPTWETVRPVEQELMELEERFQREEPSKALDAIRQAISRQILKRAANLERDPALLTEQDAAATQRLAGAEEPHTETE